MKNRPKHRDASQALVRNNDVQQGGFDFVNQDAGGRNHSRWNSSENGGNERAKTGESFGSHDKRRDVDLKKSEDLRTRRGRLLYEFKTSSPGKRVYKVICYK